MTLPPEARAAAEAVIIGDTDDALARVRALPAEERRAAVRWIGTLLVVGVDALAEAGRALPGDESADQIADVALAALAACAEAGVPGPTPDEVARETRCRAAERDRARREGPVSASAGSADHVPADHAPRSLAGILAAPQPDLTTAAPTATQGTT